MAAAVDKAGMPADALEQAKKELKRLERMPDASGEYSMLRTWLDWMIQLPWSKLDSESIDIENARRVLDEDHYGLEKVKDRILDFLAVRKLRTDNGMHDRSSSQILCLAGPPGVGKTSLRLGDEKAFQRCRPDRLELLQRG